MNAAATGLIVSMVGLLAWRIRPRVSRIDLADPAAPRDVVGPAVAASTLSPAVGALVRRWRWLRLRRAGPSPEAVASWCDELARRIRSGSTLRDALSTTVPPDILVRRATELLRLRLERGHTVTEAVREAVARTAVHGHRPCTHLELAMGVIASAARVGGPSAVALEHTAATLRLRAADRQERLAHAAQARLSAHVLTIIPLAMLGLLCLTDADVRDVVRSPIGAASVGVGLLGNGAGWVWMRRIIGGTQ
jgi:Flp pilus assembly protein TadB